MQATKTDLRPLLARGDMSTIAKQLDMSRQAVSDALAIGRPGNRVVQVAMRMIKASGSLEVAQDLATLTAGAKQ